MRLYGAISKVTPLDDGTIMVEGIASSEAVDEQGEIITAEAMRAALPDYMVYPALREMHQLQAAGTTLEAIVDDSGITRIAARVVDPVAITKVKNLVYRGFSIGGRVTKRDPTNSHIIIGLILSEISLVDRPANPEAKMECWKAGGIEAITEGKPSMPGLATLGDLPAGEKLAAIRVEPIQVWQCGDKTHDHLGKDEARRCIEKRAVLGENGGNQWDPEPVAKSAEEIAAIKAPAPAEQVADKLSDNAQPAAEEPAEEPAEKAAATPEAVEKTEETAADNSAGNSAGNPPAEAVDKTVENSGSVAQPNADVPPAQAGTEVLATEPEAALAAEAEAASAPSPTDLALAAAAEAASLARAALGTTSEPEATTDEIQAAETPVETANTEDGAVAEKASEGEADPPAEAAVETAEAEPAEDATKADGKKDKPKGDYGDVEYADPGYQSDGKPRYPLDTTKHIKAAWSYINEEKNQKEYTSEQVGKIKAKIVSAWKEKIDKAGPPSEADKASAIEIWGRAAIAKSLGNAFDLIQVIYYLEDLVDMLTWESMVEGDNSAMPATVQGLVAAACAALRQLVDEETSEVVAGDDADMVEMAAKAGGMDQLTAAFAPWEALARLVAKATGKMTEQNQMHLDKAYECASQARGMDGCSKAAAERLGDACKCMMAAGAQAMTAKSSIRGEIEVIGKAGGHQALMDVAHFCLASMGTGCCSGAADKTSSEMVAGQVGMAHDHLCAAGASCGSAEKTAAVAAAAEDALAKLAGDRAQHDIVQKALIEITPLVRDLVEQNAALREQLATITETVERIDNTPQPPMAMARTAGMSKAADNGAAAPAQGGDAVVNALALMTPKEQTLTMIKAAYQKPRVINMMNASERAALGFDPLP